MFDLNKWLKEREQRLEAERDRRQAGEYANSPYAQLMASKQRMGDYLSNPENAQRVSPLQAQLLEGNGGLVVGGHPQEKERQEGGFKSARKEG